MTVVIPIKATVYLNGRMRDLTGEEYLIAKEIIGDPGFKIISVEYRAVEREDNNRGREVMEIKHTMTGNEISYAFAKLELLIKKRYDLICRLQDRAYTDSKVLFQMQHMDYDHDKPDDDIEVSPEVFELSTDVMNKDLDRLLAEEVKP